jgi:hypothetical protein
MQMYSPLAGLFTHPCVRPATASQAREPDSPSGFWSKATFNPLPHPWGNLCSAIPSPFIPAQRDGLPVAASTDINISWRFPWPETPAQ